jgi:23S rRNA (adenine2503-C2)-methyltransferase
MKILRNLQVPTGNILVVQGERGKLEMLSLGDYGKDVNLKSDALGLTREIEKVQHSALLPLTEKWVLTLSTQYGCSMGCVFCDVPKVGPGMNATFSDLVDQVMTGLELHPEIEATDRLNIHYARMGEPTWNRSILNVTPYLQHQIGKKYKLHPVISTMMPKNNTDLRSFIVDWMWIKNDLLDGNAGLQLSINSTCEHEREAMFRDNAHTLESISEIMQGVKPRGRKITLNFAICGHEIDPDILLKYFNPEDYIIKITPMHKTRQATKNQCETEGDYTTYAPYKEIEQKLVAAGYDVLVFIASEYEDMGRITCGNAILSGTLPECPYTEMV